MCRFEWLWRFCREPESIYPHRKQPDRASYMYRQDLCWKTPRLRMYRSSLRLLHTVNFRDLILSLRQEQVYDSSRFDFAGETNHGPFFLEIKGVTLERNGIAYFPDAPTERGVKHLRELIRAKKNGSDAGILFIIQMKGVSLLRPNRETHPAFADALREAAEAGVQLGALDCRVLPGQVEADCSVPIELI